MKLYGIVRRKLGKTKMKVCVADRAGNCVSPDKASVDGQLSDLIRSHGGTYEYVMVEFTGEEPL